MRELRLVMLGLAAVMLLLLAAGFVGRALHPPGRNQERATASVRPAANTPRAAVEAAIADAPDYTRFFDRLRLAFPSDYDTILNSLAAEQAKRSGEPDIDVLMAEAVATLRRAHGAMAAKASDAALGQIFSSNLREMKAMGEVNPELCVSFLFGAAGSGLARFSADHRALVADDAIAGLDAISSGRSEPVERTKPDDADFQLLDQTLATKGLSRPQIDALLDGKTAVPPIPDAEMCQAGQTYLATLATLPEASRDRLYALAVDLMAKS